MEFGLPPNILEVTDVSQLLGLVVARDALEDAGYSDGSEWDRDKTGVILGIVGMATKTFVPLMNRLQYPVWEKVLKTSGVEARSLALEITETSLLVDPREAAARLADLRSVAGLQLSLDDFGTGYSSLTYVRMFRADDPEARSIVVSTIALAKGLHARVIAEGPETEEQVRFLRANGCDSAQGFYFSHAVPLSELQTLLARGPFQLPEVVAPS